MASITLGDLAAEHDFDLLDHLQADIEVPVHAGMQAQGDLFIIPVPSHRVNKAHAARSPVPAEGIAVIEALGSGHEHRLFASASGTAFFVPETGTGQDIGLLVCMNPAYLLHPEHGATGVAPGSYVLRRQREQADEERLVAD